METLSIDVINPKARNILNNLEDLNLIKINFDNQANEFQNLLSKLRSKGIAPLSDEEIQAEVKIVRKQRYGK
jgi:hypothetical protein